MSDPYLVLGIAPETADDASVHAAYLAAVRASPPERDIARFEAVRKAYETISTHRARLAHALFAMSPPTVAELLDRAAPREAPQRPAVSVLTALLRGEP
jgi:curved DNA-binding protein CbpA